MNELIADAGLVDVPLERLDVSSLRFGEPGTELRGVFGRIVAVVAGVVDRGLVVDDQVRLCGGHV